MLRFGTHLAYLAMRTAFFGDTSPYGGRSLYVVLGLQDITVGDIDVVHVSNLSSLVEYDGFGYARQALNVVGTNENHILHRWEMTAGISNFGAIGPASQPVHSILIVLSPSDDPVDDTDAYLVAVVDGSNIIPKNGDGAKNFSVRWQSGGLVLWGPNCDIPVGTTGFAISQALGMMALHS